MNQIMNAHYSASKWVWLLIVVCQLAVFGLGVVTAAQAEPSLLMLGVIAIGAPVFLFVLRHVAETYQSRAERIRRLQFVSNTTGHKPTQAELLEIQSDAPRLPSWDPDPEGGYFYSPLPCGTQRMAHCAEEQAFFTRAAARTLSGAYDALVLAGLGLTVFYFWFLFKSLAVQASESDGSEFALMGDLFGIFFVFFGTGTFSNLWRQYSVLAATADRVFEACDRLRQKPDLEAAEVYLVVGAYDTAVAQAPPLPGLLYRIQRQKLNGLWRAHMAEEEEKQ